MKYIIPFSLIALSLVGMEREREKIGSRNQPVTEKKTKGNSFITIEIPEGLNAKDLDEHEIAELAVNSIFGQEHYKNKHLIPHLKEQIKKLSESDKNLLKLHSERVESRALPQLTTETNSSDVKRVAPVVNVSPEQHLLQQLVIASQNDQNKSTEFQRNVSFVVNGALALIAAVLPLVIAFTKPNC